jgi:hypothetical protein
LNIALDVYIALCRFLPLPLKAYVCEILGKFDRRTRRLVIYDQIHPSYAKYYSETEARKLFEDAGFRDVTLYHRHGYSWSVMGTA